MTNNANPSPRANGAYRIDWRDRLITIATMHHKEKVIAPIIKAEIGVRAIVPADFDSDRFGTFTRDIARMGNQLEAARQKALAALELTGGDLAIASEGVFIPYPSYPALPYNQEIVLFLDLINQLEVVSRFDSTETNFSHICVKFFRQVEGFAKQIGFPDHALVVIEANGEIHKGIQDIAQLKEIVEIGLQRSPDRSLHLETDMRALFNPTRMKNIERATLNLVQKLKSLCPECEFPDFAIAESKTGLPCEFCGLPTKLVKSQICKCQKCQFTQTVHFPNGQKTADPQYCQYCNP
jgi:hypothetical protein